MNSPQAQTRAPRPRARPRAGARATRDAARSPVELLGSLSPRPRLAAACDALIQLGRAHDPNTRPHNEDDTAREELRQDVGFALIDTAARVLTTHGGLGDRIGALLHRASRQPTTAELTWDTLAAAWAALAPDARRLAGGLPGLDPTAMVDRALGSHRPLATLGALELIVEMGVVDRVGILVGALGDRDARTGTYAAEGLAMLAATIGAGISEDAVWEHDRDLAAERGQTPLAPHPRGLYCPEGTDPVRAIAEALTDAMARSAEHRRPQAAHAASLLLDRTDAARPAFASLGDALGDAEHRAHRPLISALRRLGKSLDRRHPMGDAVSRRAWRWLRHAPTAGALVPILCGQPRTREARVRHPDPAPGWLRDWYLVHHPARARALRALGRHRDAHRHTLADRLLDAALVAPELAHGVPALLAPLSGIEGDTRRTSDARLTLPTARARLGAVREAPSEELADWCFDPDPRVARHAAYRWAMGTGNAQRAPAPTPVAEAGADMTAVTGTGMPSDAATSTRPEPQGPAPKRLALAGVLERLPDPMVASVGRDELGCLGFDPSEPACRLRWRRALVRDAQGTVAAIFRHLREPAHLRPTIELTRSLGLGALIAPELLRLAPEIDPGATKTLASLAAVLAQSPRADGVELLVALCGHDDHRVRSNAIRALVRSDPELARAILNRMLDDTAHRPRGEAVRCGLAPSGGLLDGTGIHGVELEAKCCDTLLSMLGDHRTPHRLAGVWAAGRVLRGRVDAGQGSVELKPHALTAGANTALAARLAEIAAHDPDPGVRVRAARTTRVLEQQVRAGWSRTPAGASDHGTR